MTEILTESFCERCGTRYTFETVQAKGRSLGTLGTLGRGLRHFVLSSDSSFDESMAVARSEAEQRVTTAQLEAFHRTFNFCLSCRQYTCADCWNAVEGRCLTCAPLPEVEVETATPIQMTPEAVAFTEMATFDAGPPTVVEPELPSGLDALEAASTDRVASEAAIVEAAPDEPAPLDLEAEAPQAEREVAEPEAPEADVEIMAPVASEAPVAPEAPVGPETPVEAPDAQEALADAPQAQEPVAALVAEEPTSQAEAPTAEAEELPQTEPDVSPEPESIEAEAGAVEDLAAASPPEAALPEPEAAAPATEPQPETAPASASVALPEFLPGRSLDDEIAAYELRIAALAASPPEPVAPITPVVEVAPPRVPPAFQPAIRIQATPRPVPMAPPPAPAGTTAAAPGTCRSCGLSLSASARFCRRCGTAQVA